MSSTILSLRDLARGNQLIHLFTNDVLDTHGDRWCRGM